MSIYNIDKKEILPKDVQKKKQDEQKIDDLLARLAIASNNKKFDESKRILSEIDRLQNKTGLSADIVDDLATIITKKRFHELESENEVNSFEIGFTVRKNEKGPYIPLEIDQGQLTLIAAPTGHGKTTIMINMMLNMAKKYPDKKFYFFSYEEKEDIVRQRILISHVLTTDRINQDDLQDKSDDYFFREVETNYLVNLDYRKCPINQEHYNELKERFLNGWEKYFQ